MNKRIQARIEGVIEEYNTLYDVDPEARMHLDRLGGMFRKEFVGDGEHCGICEASLKSYWQSLTPLLVNCLVLLRDRVVLKGRNKVHLMNELSLTKSQYNNFQKLRFHGLIAHVTEDGDRVTGYWLITRRGAEFLQGKKDVPARVKTFRNRVIDHDTKFKNIEDILGSKPYMEDRDSILFDFMQM